MSVTIRDLIRETFCAAAAHLTTLSILVQRIGEGYEDWIYRFNKAR
jgi:hypothetical protein